MAKRCKVCENPATGTIDQGVGGWGGGKPRSCLRAHVPGAPQNLPMASPDAPRTQRLVKGVVGEHST